MAAAAWQQLKTLDLRYPAFSAATINQLCEGRWPMLRTLNLCALHVPSSEGRQHLALADWPNMMHLGYDGADGIQFGDRNHPNKNPASFTWLLQCQWPLLHTLDLSEVELDPKDMRVLSRCHWPLLQRLIVISYNFSNDDLWYLAQASWPNMRQLGLDLRRTWFGGTNPDVAGFSMLAAADWPQLERLYLHCRSMDAAQVAEIVKAKWRSLKVLNIGWDGPADIVRELLLGKWNALECLELSWGSQVYKHVTHALSPGNIAALKGCFGVATSIENPMLVGNGCWPNLRIIGFYVKDSKSCFFADYEEFETTLQPSRTFL